MAQVTPNLQLTVWNNLTDPYNSEQLANNFIKLDQHDHSPGKGAQIDGATGIKDASITNAKLAANSVTTGTIAAGAVQTSDIADSTGTSDGVTTGKIANSAVTTAKINDGAVTKDKLASALTSINVSGTTRPLFIDGTISTNTSLTAAFNALSIGYSPSNGDEIYYKAGSGIIWHLRYNSSATTYKWEYVGGPSLFSASTDGTEQDGTGTGYKVSTLSKINLPYAITGGIFDITISAYVTVTNDTNMIPAGQADYSTLTTAVRSAFETSVAGAFISYQWTSNAGSAGDIDAAGGANQYAGIADLLAYNKIGGDTSKNRKPATTLSLTLRTTKSSSLSNSTIAFAQRRQNNSIDTDTAVFSNRTVQIRPVAII